MNPIPDEPDEIRDWPQRTEITAPGPAKKKRCDEHKSQQYKMKVGPDQVEKGAENLVAGYARIAVEKSDRDRTECLCPLEPAHSFMGILWQTFLSTPDHGQTFLGRPEGTEPFAVGIFFVHEGDEQNSGHKNVRIEMELPLGPKPQEHLIDQNHGERFVEHKSQDKKPHKHRDPAGCFFVFKTASASENSEQKEPGKNGFRDPELDFGGWFLGNG